MFIAVYDATGKIFKSLQGDDLLWAQTMIEQDWPGDWLFAETDHLVDNSCEKMDVSTIPHVVMPYSSAKTPEQTKAEILAATQRRLDDFAQTRGFDSVLSAATYAGSAVAQFAAEGQRAAALRDATWAALYGMLAAVLAGTRAMPSGFADIEAELPTLTWPA
jgi:hypothetical protein